MNHVDYPHLSNLVNNEELWSHVRDFDQMQAQAQSTKGLATAVQGENVAIAQELNALAFEHYYVTLVFRFKTRELARGIFTALSEKNHVVLFNLARAFMEHTASLAYQDEALEKAVTELVGQQNADRVRILLAAHRNVVKRLYYGGEGSPVPIKHVHVNDLLKCLYKMYEGASKRYASLCEFVHPNFGSNRLVSSGILASGRIGAQPDLLERELLLVQDVLERCAQIDADLIISGTRSLLKLANWTTLASRPGATPSKVFSLKKAVGGDGLTKDTALYFPKARTHHEAIEAFYKHVEDQNWELGPRRQVGIENGWIFDIVISSKGNLWVKYKLD